MFKRNRLALPLVSSSIEYHDRTSDESACALRHWPRWESADGCRSPAAGHEALGHPPQGGGRSGRARRSYQHRGGLRALQADRGRVPVLAAVDRQAWPPGAPGNPDPGLSELIEGSII